MNLFKAFVIGSSYFILVWPFTYLSVATKLNPATTFDFTFVPLVLPLIFGVVNVLIVSVGSAILSRYIEMRYWLFGFVYGLGLSLYGNFGKDIPVGLFSLPDTWVQFLVIPVAMILYGCVFRYVLLNLNRLFLLVK